MKWLRDIRAKREADRAAMENSKALLEEAHRTDPHIEAMQQTAQRQLRTATEQARRLGATDRQNHYSESLTLAFRGPAR